VVAFILNTTTESGEYHRETHHFSEEKSTKELTALQHTRFILPPDSLDKIHRYAAWAVFFFYRKSTLKIS